MSYQYPPPPPTFYSGQGPIPAQMQPQQPAPQQGWVDNRQVIGGWSAAQYGMQTGKHLEYKVFQMPTQKGGIFKSVKFCRPYQKKNGQMGEGDGFAFNQMKELIERINHFQNTYGEEKGYFIWQPAAPTMGVGNPYPQQPPPHLPLDQQPMQYGAPPAPPQGYQQPMAPQQAQYPQYQPPAPYAPPAPPQPPQQTPYAPSSLAPPGGTAWP